MSEIAGITLVVPCFNEARRLDVAEFARLAAVSGVSLLFVDDGSTDATWQIIEKLSAEGEGRIRTLRLGSNQGKAEAVRSGLCHALDAGAAVVGYLDADLSTPVDEILRLCAVLAARPEVAVVIASRVRLLGNAVERRPLRHYLGRIFATAASLALALDIYDTQCGAKLLRASPAVRAAVAEPFVSRWVFDVELLGRLVYGTATSPGLPASAFAEVPLQAWRDVAGSKLGPTAMLRAAADLARIHARLRQRRSGPR